MKFNDVKVLKIAQNFTSLQVKVLQNQDTSLQLKVLEKLTKYCNALLSLRYFTALLVCNATGDGFAPHLRRYFRDSFLESILFPALRDLKWSVWHCRN